MRTPHGLRCGFLGRTAAHFFNTLKRDGAFAPSLSLVCSLSGCCSGSALWYSGSGCCSGSDSDPCCSDSCSPSQRRPPFTFSATAIVCPPRRENIPGLEKAFSNALRRSAAHALPGRKTVSYRPPRRAPPAVGEKETIRAKSKKPPCRAAFEKFFLSDRAYHTTFQRFFQDLSLFSPGCKKDRGGENHDGTDAVSSAFSA